MPFTSAIAIVISRPLPHAISHRGMGWMAVSITLPFVGIKRRALCGDVRRHEWRAGACVGMITHPEAVLARLARPHADGGTIGDVGACSLRLCLRRRGGAAAPQCGVLVFSSILIQVICLKRGAGHQPGRCGLVQVALHPLASRMPLLA
jgi:hypothetical protein